MTDRIRFVEDVARGDETGRDVFRAESTHGSSKRRSRPDGGIQRIEDMTRLILVGEAGRMKDAGALEYGAQACVIGMFVGRFAWSRRGRLTQNSPVFRLLRRRGVRDLRSRRSARAQHTSTRRGLIGRQGRGREGRRVRRGEDVGAEQFQAERCGLSGPSPEHVMRATSVHTRLVVCWLAPPYPWLWECASFAALISTPPTHKAKTPQAVHCRIVVSFPAPGGATPWPGLMTARVSRCNIASPSS